MTGPAGWPAAGSPAPALSRRAGVVMEPIGPPQAVSVPVVAALGVVLVMLEGSVGLGPWR